MAYPIQTYDDLLNLIKASGRSFDLEQIEHAYQVAAEAHKEQKRKSGEPYITHPVAAACILVELGMDTPCVVAGLLHDVVEDTDITLEEITKMFGKEIANLINGVTKLGKVPFSSREEQQAENIRKMLIAMSEDIRVIIIKLADRLHNMRTIEYMTPQKQRDKALENMEVYAPIADRLGIRAVKEELEDLSLRYLDPMGYQEIEHALELHKDERADFIQKIKTQILEKMLPVIPKVHLEGRVKSINGIYHKMFVQGKSIDQIYDVYAVRVIVDTVIDCYNALGIIHDLFHPIPNRFKDYISTPKPNLYQSLHTTVIGSEGIPFEVQIRTWDMHYTAEYGIAAHWKYKVGVTSEDSLEEHLAWVRKILDNQTESDATDLVRTIKTDLSSDSVFVFTPRGEVISLPAGSTVIDFAYAIHSAVGNRMIGAKVDKRIVPIDYKIKTGEIVEVITAKEGSHGPSRDWLNIVKSTQAKNKINQWFRSELKEENITHGKELLIASAKSKGINFPDINKPEYQEKILRKYGFHDWNSCLATIGHGGLKEGQIVNRMYEEYKKDHLACITDDEVLETIAENKDKVVQKHSKSGIIVKGLYDVAVHFSKCCSPVPGDEIVGFVTRGRGVSIHRTDCINIINLSDMERERLIDAEWQHDEESGSSGLYRAEIKIYGNNRTGLLVDITKVFTEREIDIDSIHSKTSKQGIATIDVSFSTKGREELTSVVERLRQIESIIDIERTTG